MHRSRIIRNVLTLCRTLILYTTFAEIYVVGQCDVQTEYCSSSFSVMMNRSCSIVALGTLRG